MAYYRICQHCGCNLDPDESCDCEAENEQREKALAIMVKPDAKGQMVLNLSELNDNTRVAV